MASYHFSLPKELNRGLEGMRISVEVILGTFVIILIFGCETDPTRTLHTGVNEVITLSDQPVSAAEAQNRRQEDLEPYTGLNIQGPLSKQDVVKAVQRNRKQFDKCYRQFIGDAPMAVSNNGPRPSYEPTDNQYDRSNSTMKPDGMLESTNYSTPHHGTLPTTSGEVVVNFTVESSGKVREARSNLSDFRGTFMRTCIESAVSAFQFAPHDSESKVRYLTLRFSNEVGLISSEP
jgi:hypothetical protein